MSSATHHIPGGRPVNVTHVGSRARPTPDQDAQPLSSTPYRCPVCGAVHPDGATCEDVFNALLALAFSDPVAGAAHHLTVMCYMLQHDGCRQAATRR